MGQATREEKRTKQAKEEQGISEQEKQQPRGDEGEGEKEGGSNGWGEERRERAVREGRKGSSRERGKSASGTNLP